MKPMRKFASLLCLFSLTVIFAPWGLAQQDSPRQSGDSPSTSPADTTFHGVKVTDTKGKQTDAALTFSDNGKKLVVQVANKDFMVIPYEQIDKVSYEYTKKHRIAQGAVVMAASLGAGAIVMMTKSKSHWLYIDFHEQNTPKNLVLRIDKNSYKSICDAVKVHTGKEIEFPQDGGERAREKDKNKDNKKSQ